MVFGYFVFEIFLYGTAGAAVDILGNAGQGIVGFAAGTLLFGAMHKSGLLTKIKR